MEDKQGKFGAKQGVALTVVLVLLGVGATYAWSKRSKDEQPSKAASTSQNNERKTFADTASIYTFKYPADWTITDIPNAGDGTTPPDPKVHSQPVWLRYPEAPTLTTNEKAGPYRINGISVSAGKTQSRNTGYADAFKNAKKSKVNGYDLQIATSPEDQGYRQHLYLVSDGTNDVVFMFRDKQSVKAGRGATAFDESDRLPEVREIVDSVSFTAQD